MKNQRIAIRPESSLEALLSLSPTICSLRQAHPAAEIGLIAEECFREASALLPEINFFASDFQAEPDDIVYDLSNFAGESWGQESADWKAYLQGCSAISLSNPYHQIDLQRKAAGIDSIDVNFELLTPAVGEHTMPGTLEAGGALRVAVCAVSLSIDELQSVIEGVARLGIPVSVHLLGTVSEKRKSAILTSAWDGRLTLIDLCGRQSLAQAAETLRLCDISFCGPGANALLGSGYGTFTVCVDESRNPLHYPYGHGHLVVQHGDSDEFFRSLSGLTTEIVRFALAGNQGNVPSLEQWQHFADEKIDDYLARLRFFATQRIEIPLAAGGSFTELHLRPLLFLGAEFDDVMRSFYRLLWEHSLQNRQITTRDLQILHQDSLDKVAKCLAPLEQLYELANFGRTYSLYIRQSLSEGDIGRARNESDRLQETENLIYRLGKSHAALAPLCAFHEKKQRLLPATEPDDLAQQMSQSFADIQSRVLVLLDLASTLFHTNLQNEPAPASAPSEEGISDG